MVSVSPVDQLEHPLQYGEKATASLYLPCLVKLILLKCQSFSHLLDQPVQDIHVHDP